MLRIDNGVLALGMSAAFLNADIVTPNKEAIVVKVPAVFRIKGAGESKKLFMDAGRFAQVLELESKWDFQKSGSSCPCQSMQCGP